MRVFATSPAERLLLASTQKMIATVATISC